MHVMAATAVDPETEKGSTKGIGRKGRADLSLPGLELLRWLLDIFI